VPPGQRTEGDIIELARLCSDLPLALRIAGNRIASQPAHTAADFVRRLRSDDQRLRALVATAAVAGSLFAPNAAEGQAERPEWLTDRVSADQWLRWNREQWWPAFQHAARIGHDREIVSVAEALH
jgi:hypothetical protein